MNKFDAPKEAHTPEQMRSEISRLRRENVLVYNTMNAAERFGFNSKDCYTFLAYHALLELSKWKEAHIEYVMKNPQTSLIQ